MRIFTAPILFTIFSLATACSSQSANLKPYREESPTALLAEVDKHVYSPVSAGLKKATADLVVDISGFYPKEKRPAEPVWVTVKFAWDQGRSAFNVSDLPGKSQDLEKKLLEILQGKEEDLINRPFSQRLQGDQLALSESENGNLIVTAVPPDSKDNHWKLAVDPNFRVPRVQVTAGLLQIESELEYDQSVPAKITRIASRYVSSGQTTSVTVDFTYQKVGAFELPSRLVYTSSVDKLEFPPLTIDVKNFNVATR